MVHCIQQGLPVQHIDIHVITRAAKESVEYARQIGNSIFRRAPETSGHQRCGKRNAILRVAIGNLSDRSRRGMDPMAVSSIHRICSGSEWLAAAPAVRGIPGVLALYGIRPDG